MISFGPKKTATTSDADKIKAMRNAAAQRTMASIESVRATFAALQARGVKVSGEQKEVLVQLVEGLAPLLPGEAVESDDDEYY